MQLKKENSGRFKIGDIVNFLYIDPENGWTYLCKDAKINNSWFEDKLLLNSTINNDPYYRRYYFGQGSHPVQFVWIPENRVFDINEKLPELLFGEYYVPLF